MDVSLAVQTECMMQMVIEQVSPFSVFLVENNLTSLEKWDVQKVREGLVCDYECEGL